VSEPTPPRSIIDPDVAVNVMQYLAKVLPDDCVFVLAIAKPVASDETISHQVMSDAPLPIILSIFRAFLRASRGGYLHSREREGGGDDGTDD